MTNNSSFTSNKGVNLIGGGKVNKSQIDDIRISKKQLFCADSGLNYAIKYNLLISGLIGDLDSVDIQKNVYYPVYQDLDQNTNDLEKSLHTLSLIHI